MERKYVVTFEERESLDRNGMPDEQDDMTDPRTNANPASFAVRLGFGNSLRSGLK
jgi:hypothetical protein